MLQFVAVCCSVCVRSVVTALSMLNCSELQFVAVCCSLLQCVAMCCSVLQCVALCCSVCVCYSVATISMFHCSALQ